MSKIILKKSSVASKVPLAADLDYGELALNYTDGRLFYKTASNTISEIGSGSNTALQNRSSQTATSGQTVFNIEYTAPYVDVYKNGVKLSPSSDYTATNGTSIVLAVGAIVGDLIECIASKALLADTIDALVPSQTGNSGKYLTTDGTAVSWASVSGGGGGGTSPYSNEYVFTGTTTNATETEIFIGGVSNTRMPAAANKNIFYTVDIVARETSAGTNYGAFTLKSIASNRSGTVSDLGNIYEVVIARSSATISIDTRADNTNKTINLYVTGLNSVTLSWRAVVTTVEV